MGPKYSYIFLFFVKLIIKIHIFKGGIIMDNIIKLEDRVGVKEKTTTKTVGKELKKRYLNSLDPDKKLDYSAKAKQYLENAIRDIQDNIDKGKAPIAIISSGKTKSNIIVTDNSMAELFQDFAFNVICNDMANSMGLRIGFEGQAMADPSNPTQPIVNIVMTVTFK